jgi:hypothetical protein
MGSARGTTQNVARVALCISWLTVIWAAVSFATYQGVIHVPPIVQRAVALSGAIALVGLVLGLASLVAGPKSQIHIVVSALGALLNGLWMWLMLRSL